MPISGIFGICVALVVFVRNAFATFVADDLGETFRQSDATDLIRAEWVTGPCHHACVRECRADSPVRLASLPHGGDLTNDLGFAGVRYKGATLYSEPIAGVPAAVADLTPSSTLYQPSSGP